VFKKLGISLAATPRRALLSGLRRRAFIRMRGFSFEARTEDLDPRDVIRVDTLYSMASGLAMNDPLRAMDVQTQHCIHALRLGEPYRAARAVASHATPYAVRGSTHAHLAARVLQVADELADASGDPNAHAFVGLVRGFGAYGLGQWIEARDRLLVVEQQLLECPGASWELATCRFFLTMSLIRLGDFADLERRIPDWIEDARQRKDMHALANLRMSLAYAALADDDVAGARASIEQAASHWRRAEVPIATYREFYMLAQVYLYEGRVDRAHEALERAWPSLRETMLLRMQEVRVAMRYIRGQTFASMGAAQSGKSRSRWLRRAAKEARSLLGEGAHWAQPMGLSVQAHIAFTRDDPRRGQELLQAAVRLFDECHMTSHSAAARVILGRSMGGQQGASAGAEAGREMRLRGVANPDRFTRWLAW
jgi:hypothetical protein